MLAHVHLETSQLPPFSNGNEIGFPINVLYNWEFGKSSDFIYHEYTHCVIYHIYGGHFIDVFHNDNSEAAAMDEGFADYFACAFNGESEFGEGVGSPVRDFDECDYTMDDWEFNEEYNNGMIIGGACWDMRKIFRAHFGESGCILADTLVSIQHNIVGL